jgi:nitric oxide reductase subunit B
MQTDLMQNLRWMRVIGDTIFAAGIMALGWFVLGLKTGWSLQPGVDIDTPVKLPSSRRAELAGRD